VQVDLKVLRDRPLQRASNLYLDPINWCTIRVYELEGNLDDSCTATNNG